MHPDVQEHDEAQSSLDQDSITLTPLPTTVVSQPIHAPTFDDFGGNSDGDCDETYLHPDVQEHDEAQSSLDQDSITLTPIPTTVLSQPIHAPDFDGNVDGDEVATVTVVEHSTPETPKRTRQYRLSKRKCRKIDKILQDFHVSSLSIEERKIVLSKSLENQESHQESHQENVESKIADALLVYLKSLYLEKKYDEFYNSLQNIFPVYDKTISNHIAKFIDIRPVVLSTKFQ